MSPYKCSFRIYIIFYHRRPFSKTTATLVRPHPFSTLCPTPLGNSPVWHIPQILYNNVKIRNSNKDCPRACSFLTTSWKLGKFAIAKISSMIMMRIKIFTETTRDCGGRVGRRTGASTILFGEAASGGRIILSGGDFELLLMHHASQTKNINNI